jgi:hypothetical protein
MKGIMNVKMNKVKGNKEKGIMNVNMKGNKYVIIKYDTIKASVDRYTQILIEYN